MKQNKNLFKTKAFRAGGYSTAATAIVIIIAVVINLIVSSISTAYTNIDTTDAGLYSISEQTKSMVSSLEKEVTIYYVATEDAQAGYVKKLLDKYASCGKKLSVKYIDPDVEPDFSKEYTTESVTDGDLIVVCGDNAKVVHYADMVVYEAGSYEYYVYYLQNGTQTDVYWNGETEITKAIDFVISDASYKVYFMDSDGSAYFDDIETALENENITCVELTEEDTKISLDASCVVLSGVSTDITEAQYKMLSEYLAGGGKLYIAADYGDEERPQLDKLLADFGLSFTAAALQDGDSNYGDEQYILPKFAGEHAIIAPFSKANYICFPNAMGIKINTMENVTATPLLTTSESAHLSTDESDDIHFAVFNLGVAAENTTSGAQIVVFGTTEFTSDTYMNDVRYSNSDLFVNSIGYLCDKDSAVTLHAKSVTSDTTLDFSRTNTGGIIFIIAVVPAIASIAAGFIIWYRRKNK